MLEVIPHPNCVNKLSGLLGLEPTKLVKLCNFIESRGYCFRKSYDGNYDFNDTDVAVILSLY
ncbi:hypothetical protein [Paenibacillus sedimenti]|uniref:Uncharacterized protein n=1 Tax=Paenibacillus sedimenti TaxID=2770274 RepID=A0A926KK45_9BACL|nr:hypothetical protein [Paenibacillus sedimenti]MBD0379234.1 hypothetical protein [Paenibacillus sedimenti]